MDEEVKPVETEEAAPPEGGETAAGLNDELMSFGDDEAPEAPADDAGETNGDEPPAGEAPAGEEAAKPDFFDTVLPDDERLPKPWRGKATIKDVLENTKQLVTKFQQAREEANTLNRKIETQNAVLESLRRAGVGETAQPQQEFRELTVEEKLQYYGVANLQEELFDNPTKVFAAYDQMRRDEMMEAQRPLIEQQQETETSAMRREHTAAAQEAWVNALDILAANGDQVGPDEWTARSPEVVSLVRQDYHRWLASPQLQAERPDPSRDPIAYAAAYRTVMSRWGVAQQRAEEAAPPAAMRQPRQPVVDNPPHASRTSTATAPSSTRVSAKMESEIREWAKEWKMPVEKVREIFLEVEEGR